MTDEATTSKTMDAGGGEADRASERIAHLLERVRGSTGPTVWPEVEALVREIVDLYGRGLSRVLDILGEAQLLDVTLAARLTADELVSSLLVLHGLHPEPVRLRVERTLRALEPVIGRLEVVAIEGSVVRLRVVALLAHPQAKELLERALAEAAPELERVEAEGLGGAAPSDLVQIDLVRSRARG